MLICDLLIKNLSTVNNNKEANNANNHVPDNHAGFSIEYILKNARAVRLVG
jgi:hypothetical protein